jgi:nitrate reductase molybdenum cofactor assembly chaperone NarJ/NarW
MSVAIYALFADVLDYPSPALTEQVRHCLSELTALQPEAAEMMRQFQTEQAKMTLGELEELYTSTFELQPDCTPNLGFHLFGNDARRNMFMAQLKQRMEAHHVALGSELPDHLSLILRLLAREGSEEERSVLIEDCLVPAASRMVDGLGQHAQSNAYEYALRALLIILRKESRAETAPFESLHVIGDSELR